MALALMLAGSIVAQKGPVPGRLVSGLPLQSGQDVTFSVLVQTPRQQTFKTTQVRRFRDDQGGFVAVREQLTVAGNGTKHSPFRLNYLGLDSSSVAGTDPVRWTEIYRRHASLFHEHGGFRVYDAEAAARNYTLYPIGSTVRAGRIAERVVVLPRRLPKSIWLIEVDRLTGLVLYAGEYDSSLRLVSEVEVLTLLIGAQVGPLTGQWAWRPRMQVTRFNTLDEVLSAVGDAGGLIRPRLDTAVPEYLLWEPQTTENPLHGETSVVLTYTDGVDSFFVIETPGQTDPFQGTPSMFRMPAQKGPHTMAFYDDPSMRVYLFFHEGVGFTVVGRGASLQLETVARSIYRQAIQN